MLGGLQTIWAFLVLIGIMILLHELGHYLVARLFDVHVEAFSFGFGPRLFGFKRGETDFRVCLIPMGGYVKMVGEQPGEIADSAVPQMDSRAFPAKPRWQRLCIIFAGPAVNFVLAIGILAGLFMFQYPRVADPPRPVIGYLSPDGAGAKAGLREGDRIIEVDGAADLNAEAIHNKELVGVGRSMKYVVERDGQRLNFEITPAPVQGGVGSTGWDPAMDVRMSEATSEIQAARNAGLKPGDVFVRINGVPIRSAHRMIDTVEASGGKPIQVVYSRNGQEQEVTITPENAKEGGKDHWRIGAGLAPAVEIVQLPFHEALSVSWTKNKEYAGMLYKFLQGIVEQRMSPKSIDGPIRIAQLSGEAAREGVTSFLSLMAMVSLNLAVVNMLPIPLLDGGGILMLLIEMLMQRDLSMRVKEGIVKVGFAFLMMVIVFVLYNDISKTFSGG
jgi:regulator of sigma E protease